MQGYELNTRITPPIQRTHPVNVRLRIILDGSVVEFKATVLLNTDVGVNNYRNGGILHTALRNLVK
ncbi:MAG: hypothetical protein DPW18_05835 [Chloroflexi bacterium]|nr:hypothetical protein [Chloroflexota bacterium]MDL1942226.1 hypothetical protein [Chloroflexi bacterium CFX2]